MHRCSFILLLLALVALASASRDLNVGYREQGDRFIFQKQIDERGWPFLVADKTVTLPIDGNFKITLVEIVDLKNNKNSAKLNIIAGGRGQSYITIKFESARGHGIHYLVKVYGKPSN